jgi:predicted ATP-binding protein involved in virulence
MTDLGKELLSSVRLNDKSLILPIVVYYGTGRLWGYYKERRTDTFKSISRLNGYIGALDGTANIKLMMNWFKKMTVLRFQRKENGLGDIPEFDVVCKAVEAYYEKITNHSNTALQYNLETNELDIYYDEGSMRMSMPLSQLSDGYKGTLSLIADIAYRMSLLNPDLMENALTETPGIIMIDEVDLHLHPTWQERILDDLMTIFPRVQFIVTTHAPIVINSIRSESLILLRDNQPERAGIEVYGKDANSIIQSVMRSNERPKRVKRLFDDFYEAIDEENYVSARNILDKIEGEIGTDDPEAVSCEVLLSMEQV